MKYDLIEIVEVSSLNIIYNLCHNLDFCKHWLNCMPGLRAVFATSQGFNNEDLK